MPSPTVASCLLALVCALGGAATARAEGCPTQRLGANNGSPLSSCAPVADAPGSCSSASDSRVRDLVITSVALGNKPSRTRIILPKNYEAQPNKSWPVLYLLTGHGASYRSWTCASKVRDFVDGLDVLVVMPEGAVGTSPTATSMSLGNADAGIPGWYSNWQSPDVKITNSSGMGPSVQMNLRTHHTEELRDVLNKNFRADNSRYAVAGLSMGGYGAAAYALGSTSARPFVAVATFSALLDTELLSAGIPYVGGLDAPSIVRGSIEVAQAANGNVVLTGNKLWGEKTSPSWRANNPKRQVAAGTTPLASLPFYLSTGQGNSKTDIDLIGRFFAGQLDATEVGAYFSSTSFLSSLRRSVSTGLTTEFFPKGGHSWPLWNVNICRALNLTLVKALDPAQTPYPLASCPKL